MNAGSPDTTLTPGAPWHTTVTIHGNDICIRPIEHRDIKLYDAFIHNLPDDIQRNRLGIDLNHFSSDELIALCDVDYHDSMAFVAIIESDPESTGRPRMVGVARYHTDSSDIHVHKMAVDISGAFPGTSLTEALMDSLIGYARQHGIAILKAVDAWDNQDMKQLAIKLGMTPTRDYTDPHKVTYTLSLFDASD
jgi:acetyltransferase